MRNVCARLVIHRIVCLCVVIVSIRSLGRTLTPHPTLCERVCRVHTSDGMLIFCYGWSQYISNVLLSLLFDLNHTFSHSAVNSNTTCIQHVTLCCCHWFKKRCHFCIYNSFFSFILASKEKNALNFCLLCQSKRTEYWASIVCWWLNARILKITNKIWMLCWVPLSKIATFWSNEHAQWPIYINNQRQRYAFHYANMLQPCIHSICTTLW